MDRRTFLKLVGATSAAAVLQPAVLCVAAGEPERFVGEYALALHGATQVRFSQLAISPLILPAPPGRACRAVIYPGPVRDQHLVAYVTGAISGNDPKQVVIERIAPQGGPSYLASSIDANVFNTSGLRDFGPVVPDIPLPVDWGVVSDERHLVIDYAAIGPDHQTLYLGLAHTFHDAKAGTGYGCPPGWPSSS